MNINIHLEKNFWNLGLCRVTGSMPAKKCIDLLEHELLEFDISLEDIVSSTTDGAAVNKKVGKLIEPHHQLYFTHGLHLALVEVLYKKDNSQEIVDIQ